MSGQPHIGIDLFYDDIIRFVEDENIESTVIMGNCGLQNRKGNERFRN